jgi:hypothetical protein
VHSKIEFARLLDELELPQPGWRLIRGESDTLGLPFPYWLEAAYSTAGQGVREVFDERSRAAALLDLVDGKGAPVMAQQSERRCLLGREA